MYTFQCEPKFVDLQLNSLFPLWKRPPKRSRFMTTIHNLFFMASKLLKKKQPNLPDTAHFQSMKQPTTCWPSKGASGIKHSQTLHMQSMRSPKRAWSDDSFYGNGGNWSLVGTFFPTSAGFLGTHSTFLSWDRNFDDNAAKKGQPAATSHFTLFRNLAPTESR